MHFFITCPKGIEALLEDELGHFGATSLKQTLAGVQAEADIEFAYRTCLWSRLANRVLLLLIKSKPIVLTLSMRGLNRYPGWNICARAAPLVLILMVKTLLLIILILVHSR